MMFIWGSREPGVHTEENKKETAVVLPASDLITFLVLVDNDLPDQIMFCHHMVCLQPVLGIIHSMCR